MNRTDSHPGEIGGVVRTAHIVVGDGEAMNEPITYEIVIRGHASERLLARLSDDFSIDTSVGRHTRLVGEMTANGPAAALEVCHTDAAVIAAAVAEEHGVRIGRTSARLRNPSNAAPDWAAAFVAAEDASPHALVAADGTFAEWTPIRIAPPCLNCHGPRETLAPPVLEALMTRYAEDRAVDYAEGELRGWFWVEVPAS